MKQAKYRVEAFIIPVGNDCFNESVLTETDDAKITDKLRVNKANCTEENSKLNDPEDEKNHSFSSEDESLQNLKNLMVLENVIDGNDIKLHKINQDGLHNFDLRTLYPLNSIKRVQTLTAIAENHEDTDEKDTNLCYHGCKNGCSSVVQTPQEVSEEVFKDNWLQKLEAIKQKEAALKSKEILLQNRERALFKREREVRITERLLKDKMKQVELYLNQNESLQPTLKTDILQDVKTGTVSCTVPKGIEKLCHTNNSKIDLSLQDLKKESTVKKEEPQQEKISTCGSSSSSESNITEEKKLQHRPSLRSSMTLKSSRSRLTKTSSKSKKPCKVYYEDLDTTLSADIGDSSFVQTAQKFNPEVYRRPQAFTRSASERRVKRTENRNSMNPEFQTLAPSKEEYYFPTGIEQDKVLKRVAQNISASQDRNTKFQHYGLIDQRVETVTKECRMEEEFTEEKKYSYLNLETGGKLSLQQKIGRGFKDRPISWNEGTNEWLQKKRLAYNLTNKKMPTEDFENKENFKTNKTEKPEKNLKKKDIKNKIFTIFW